MNKYTDEQLIDLLKSKAKELGRTPTKREVPQYQTIFHRIGWNEALKMAGLIKNYNRSKDDYIEILELCAEKLGHTPSMAEFISLGYDCTQVQEVFGSWNKALEEAKLNIKLEAKVVKESNEELISMYIEVCNKLGKFVGKNELLENELYTSNTFRIRFGSINELKKIVANDPRLTIKDKSYRNRNKKYNKEMIIDMLSKEYIKHGRRLTEREIDIKSKDKELPSLTTIMSYFKTTKINDVWEEIEDRNLNIRNQSNYKNTDDPEWDK